MPRKRRRTKGEGTGAYQTGDGRWRAEVNLGTDGTGKRVRKIIYGRTRAEVDTQLRNELNSRDSNTLLVGSSPTLLEWLEHWLDHLVQVRPQTLVNYRGYVRRYITPTTQARVKLSRLSHTHLEVLYSALRERGLSETTLHQLHRILSRALKIAVRQGVLALNPAERVEAPTPAPFDPGVIDTDDARRLIRLAETEPGGARWIVALSLGLRQGERLALGWDQVDFERGQLTVKRELLRLPWAHGCALNGGGPTCGRKAPWCPQRHGGGLHIDRPKSAAGSRTVPLPGPVASALRAHKEQQYLRRLQLGTASSRFVSANGVEIDLVFCQDSGVAIDPRRDWGDWKAFLKKAGVPEARVHDARHTTATVLLLMGVDSRIVMEVMGWSQQSMLTRYQHVLDEMKQQAVSKVTDALWQSPAPKSEVISLAAHRSRRQR